jgi:sterol desaturase/sphingolipid hydroxylase (fatty acid hydroxylase superfamily)
METLLNYLANLPDVYKILWLALWLSVASVAELFIPLDNSKYSRLQHLKVNLFFLATTIAVNAVFSALLVKLLPVLSAMHFGLFYQVDLPLWIELIVALLILDLLAQYTIHYLLHNVSWLWRFHQVHHSDTHVTATTGTRHHPIDYFTRESFTLATVVLLGAPMGIYMFYRLLTVFCTYFTHSNIALPARLDKLLSYVIITPNAHKFHHHYKMPWTNRNYGNIFSIWDRLFSTFVYDNTGKIQYGVDTMDDKRANSISYQLIEPFRGPANRSNN